MSSPFTVCLQLYNMYNSRCDVKCLAVDALNRYKVRIKLSKNFVIMVEHIVPVFVDINKSSSECFFASSPVQPVTRCLSVSQFKAGSQAESQV